MSYLTLLQVQPGELPGEPLQAIGFLWLIAIFIASSILFHYLKPSIETDNDPTDFRPPEPREGEPITVIFGTVKVSPSLAWFGDVHGRGVVKRESSLFGLVSQEVPLGNEWLAGMQLVLCHGPIDAILDIAIGEFFINQLPPPEKKIAAGVDPQQAWVYTNPKGPWLIPVLPIPQDPTVVYLNIPNLFGGPEEGGGVVGQLDIHWGSDTQGQNPYLALWMGPDILPQYRGVSYVVLRRMNMGKSPQPLPWHFICRRLPNVLGQSALHNIDDADGNGTANPAECIYELLTDTRWGVGMSIEDIDTATFQAVGQTLHTEGLGYNGQLVRRQTAYSAIRTILDHIDGLLYQDPITGLIGLLLVREDYTIGSLPEFNEQNAVLEQFTRGSWGEIVNETSVKYTDIQRKFSEGSAQAQNIASIQAMREIISQEVNLPGLSTHDLAQDAAARRNRTSSIPVVRGRIATNRFGFNLHQGSPFKIDFPHHNVTALACRVTSIDYGSLTEGRMVIEFVQDPFAHLNPFGSPLPQEDNVFCGPLALLVSGYNPADDPGADYGEGDIKVFAAPYWHVGAVRRAWTTVSRRTNSDVYWLPWRSVHGNTWERPGIPKEFGVFGLLDEVLLKTTIATVASLTVRNFGDMELLTSTDAAGRVAGERLAIIDNGTEQEIVAWETITDNADGTFTLTNVMRGVLDTVPVGHHEGSRVLFYWNNAVALNAHDLSTQDYDDATHFAIRAARVDLLGEEEQLERAGGDGVLLEDRATASYPPGKVTLDGFEYDAWPAATSGDVTLGWTLRSRTLQTTIVAQDDATAYTLEGTITVEVLIDNLVVRTFAGLTGSSQIYTFVQRQADDADESKPVIFRITPIGAASEVGFTRDTPQTVMSA